jgi:uncharacterized protein YbbK (DUF523 family)
MILISACLVGVNCRYNGKNTVDAGLAGLIKEGKAIALCPEILGELPTPRPPCEIVKLDNGEEKIISKDGIDHTNAYIEGALKTLEVCKILGITKAILQSRSPSCGNGTIYDGTFSGQLIDGDGVTTRLLLENGIKVFNEMNWCP